MAQRHAAEGLVVLGINAWDEPEGEIKRFVQEKNLKTRMLLDGSRVAEQYGITGIPVVLWIDREGDIVDAALGLARAGRIKAKTVALLQQGE